MLLALLSYVNMCACHVYFTINLLTYSADIAHANKAVLDSALVRCCPLVSHSELTHYLCRNGATVP